MDIKTPAADVGVIIGRFQTPDLHAGHRNLIDSVRGEHKKVLMFICSTPGVFVTRRNPLDYYTRMLMMQENYPDMIILPLHDMPSDEDWSRCVDQKIAETFGDHISAALYGSRDAFIPHYTGKFPTVELTDSFNFSGTEARQAASQEVRQHSEFRRGVVYAAHNKHPAVYPTVDIAVIRYSSDTAPVDGKLVKVDLPQKIILGRKSTDPKDKWRLPGGFVDPRRDETLEAAAYREAKEELGQDSNLQGMQYLGSHLVDDWRYRKEIDKIVTSLFVSRWLWGALNPGDDLDEAKWFGLDNFDLDIVVEQHRPLVKMVLKHLGLWVG